MFPETIKVTLTQSIIDQAYEDVETEGASVAYCCPLRLALAQEGYRGAVGLNDEYVFNIYGEDHRYHRYSIDEAGQDIARKFDKMIGRLVLPEPVVVVLTKEN